MPRRNGKSTRLVDNYIQELYSKNIVIVKDHHATRKADADLFYRVVRRLKAEHPQDDWMFDTNKLAIHRRPFNFDFPFDTDKNTMTSGSGI